MAEDPGAPAPTLTSLVPIAELQPSCSPTKTIRSVVALLWPYSASNKSLTLLLVEPDFRLRRNKGQVRVEFHGSSAKEVARSEIGSGDEVLLSLESAEWKRDEAGVRTPGNGVEWKLSFGERVFMHVGVMLLSCRATCIPISSWILDQTRLASTRNAGR